MIDHAGKPKELLPAFSLRGESHTPEQTRELGRLLGRTLPRPAIIGLQGELGAGKTLLVKGVAEGLGLDARMVQSPTFALVLHYPDEPVLLRHADLFRLASLEEVMQLGLFEQETRRGLLFVEWWDKFAPALSPYIDLSISLAIAEGDLREIQLDDWQRSGYVAAQRPAFEAIFSTGPSAT